MVIPMARSALAHDPQPGQAPKKQDNQFRGLARATNSSDNGAAERPNLSPSSAGSRLLGLGRKEREVGRTGVRLRANATPCFPLFIYGL